jgi:MATE family multidrug resistance protein
MPFDEARDRLAGVTVAPSSSPAAPVETRALSAELLRLAYPLLLSNVGGVLLGATDTFFMGSIGTSAVAAVGLGSLLFLTMYILPKGAVNAVIVFVSQAFGAKNHAQVQRWLVVFLWAALLLSPIALFYAPLTNLFLTWSGAARDVQQQAAAYVHVRLFEIPFGLLSTVLLGYLVGKGDTRTPMLVTLGVVLANVVFNWVFVFGNLGAPRLEVVGSAVGSALSVVAGAIAAGVVVFVRHARGVRFTVPKKHELLEVLRVGGPLGVMDCVEVSAFTAFLAVTGRISTNALAASQIGNQISALAFMPGFALGTATASLVGRFIGARLLPVATRVGYLGMWLCMAWMGIVGVLFWVLSVPLATLFTRDAAVIELTSSLLKLMAFYQLFDAVNIVFRSALAGAGDTRFTALATAILAWTVMVGGAVLLVSYFKLGLLEAWLAPFVYLTMLAGLYLWRWRSGRWHTAMQPSTA